jgi:hypothetical protein
VLVLLVEELLRVLALRMHNVYVDRDMIGSSSGLSSLPS